MIWWLLGSYFVILILLVNQGTVYDYAIKKGYEGTKYRLIALIPVYGFVYFRKQESFKPLDEREVKHLISFDILSKRIGLYALLLFLFYVVLIPFSVVVYLSLKNSLLQTIVAIFLVILAFLLHQGTVVDYASKKGYEGLRVGLMGLVPVYGFIYYRNLPKRRNVSNITLRQVFKPSNMLSRLFVYAEITLVAVVVIIPVVYIFGMAFAGKSSIPNTIWPDSPNITAFKFLFEETKFTTWYWNTLSIALINMFVGTLLITGAAYVFARFSFKGKKAGLLTILVLQAFPSFMGLIAMYVLFWRFGILGQPRMLSILYIGGSIPGNLWLIKGFLTQIPKDLDESAMIDGANKFQIFVWIILPLAIPILTFVAVSMFMGPWMDYMLPGYLLQFKPEGAGVDYDVQQQWTLAVGLFKFISDPNLQNYSAFAAGALLVGLPITVLYMVFQRYLIEGIMAGATKG
ncbi:MAG: ABC transporter permease subunit [Acholeplasmataceae bacterium]|jgi:arabinogalactan oligomer/maltooligosaccharide transport system permease protein|nr:ABC transporter permease subunit [Acholeplasmataceae bacterium]